jgi:membrane associated rhomboid family serine protease/Zn-finger nucleic acid-binding protein
VWFGSGEFAIVAKQLAQSEEISPEQIQLFKRRNVVALHAVKEENRLCPQCNSPLKKFNYSYDSNIILDKCLKCDGIWADGVEVQKVASYLKDNPEIISLGKDLVKQVQVMEDLKELGSFKKDFEGKGVPFWPYFPRIILPLSDDVPKEKMPAVTVSIIAVCLIIYVCQFIYVTDAGGFFYKYGFLPWNFFSLGLFSSMFLHIGPLHLVGNMLFLWIFGDNVEDRFSHLGFVFFYLLCGIFASLVHSIFNSGSNLPVIGASGAVSGVMGAYYIFYPGARIKLLVWYRIVHLPAVFYLAVWFVYQFAAGILSKSGMYLDVAWFAHIGGFVFGAVVAFIIKLNSNQKT